ncbi:Aerobic glycerol-3-phosphate dehydrogenase [compost metagenome]
MGDPGALAAQLLERFAWLDPALARRWAGSYGSRAWRLLESVREPADLGERLGKGLFAREVDYLCKEEWARDAEDILWRRSKLGLLLSPAEKRRLIQYLHNEHPHRPKMRAA